MSLLPETRNILHNSLCAKVIPKGTIFTDRCKCWSDLALKAANAAFSVSGIFSASADQLIALMALRDILSTLPMLTPAHTVRELQVGGCRRNFNVHTAHESDWERLSQRLRATDSKSRHSRHRGHRVIESVSSPTPALSTLLRDSGYLSVLVACTFCTDGIFTLSLSPTRLIRPSGPKTYSSHFKEEEQESLVTARLCKAVIPR